MACTRELGNAWNRIKEHAPSDPPTLQEIDIINDVVHYKSAYYGTIMMGNPPRPWSSSKVS